MSWEIVSGIVVLLGATISVMNVVVKVNRSLINLEAAVRRLTDYMEKQEKRNSHFYAELNKLDKRVTLLEQEHQRPAFGE